MQRFRRRRSKNSAAVEDPGHKQIEKQKTIHIPARGCVSCGRPIAVGNSYCDEELNATDRVTVTPMKKLLAKEMSKEGEIKKQSPSLIARLMGLDGMPAQPVHRHKKALSDDFELRKNAQVYGSRSSRNSAMDQQNFKDVYVYEDLEMEILQQKYMKMEAHSRLSKQEFPNILNSKNEFHNSLKHRPDLNGVPSTSRISQRKYSDSLNDHSAHISPKPHMNEIIPAKIVVLRPNIGKMRSSSSSPYSYHDVQSDYTRRLEYSSARGNYFTSDEMSSPSDYMKHMEYLTAWGKNLSTNEVGYSRQKAKDFAKKISTRLRHENISYMRGGYVADDSSYSSENSGGESENSVARTNRNSSRSRSVPPVYSFRSEKSDTFVDDRLLISKEAGNKGKPKTVKGSFSNKKEDYSPKKIIRSREMRSDSIPYRQIKVSQTSNGVSDCNGENDSIQAPTGASDENLTLLSVHEPRSGGSNPQEASIGPSTVVGCPKPEPESLQSSKEIDQPSPVSVLEPPSLVDVSYGSDCFGRVSADLHELRLKCQLLKMESNTSPEGPTSLPLDEENKKSLTTSPSKETFSSENWESLYLSAVLVESGITENAPSTFATWSSQDYPLAPYVFDDLEKYCDESHVPKPERKLLFDRTNSAFSEIFNGFVDPCPRVGPSRGTRKVDRRVKDEVEWVLARQVAEATVDISVNVIDREMSWLGFRGEFDVIGVDLENLLVDDLIMEVFG